MKWVKFSFYALLFSILGLGCLLACVYYWLVTPFSQFKFLSYMPTIQEERLITLEPGDNLYWVSKRFSAQGFLYFPQAWFMYAKLSEKTVIKQGEYRITPADSPLSLLQKLNKGEVESYTLTFIEGQSFKEVMAALNKQKKLKKHLTNLTNQEVILALGLDIEHTEGWFFPDTYQFIYGDSDINILIRAHKKMRDVLNEQWAKRQQNLPYSTKYEALIMASIIEKETGVAYEREEIAGVFVRRLRKNMRLQTDPTVIYGMGEHYTGNITRKDLRAYTPYNTYRINGLPPTPIAMPGEGAIRAALNPAEGDSLYFVAKGDGTHAFSTTLQEHNTAVRKYQLKRVKGYRSSISSP